ncbi:L-lactate dehydrogenase [Thermosipho atlanticus]|uniref:L-lactate dehydrogenase n=1 Tax=Thermosipho atlanticus DSM 15807 TaxID=1123380 RepID=A0A1M5RAD2_9BACT|nr:L-lactate dehydrogenase [Thermosipho atlanticus]SHH23275.1 L-lactate dehydrogenase [Thermosipho atlanticus DSM 15807]
MKVSIIGAGRVGVSIAFSLLHKEIVDEMVIIDKNFQRAEGEALDLYHSTPMFKRSNIYAGDFEKMKGSDFVVITAGASQNPGETRLDLTKRNAGIIKSIAREISKYARNSIIINVTNPVDVLTYILWKETGISHERVIGSGTILDTSRFRSLVSRQCRVSPTSIHAYIIGEHGDSELMVWSSATIGGVNIKEFCKRCTIRSCTPLENLFVETKNAAYTIIEKKGATNLAIGAVTATFIESMYKDEKRVWTPSILIDDLYIGFPAIVGRNGVERIVNIQLDEQEKELFEKSKSIIKKYLTEVIG